MCVWLFVSVRMWHNYLKNWTLNEVEMGQEYGSGRPQGRAVLTVCDQKALYIFDIWPNCYINGFAACSVHYTCVP